MQTDEFQIGPKLGDLVAKIVASYEADPRTQHIDRVYLPSRTQIVSLVNDMLELLYPGFIGRHHLTRHNVAFHVGDLLPRIAENAFRQIRNCLCYMDETQDPADAHESACDEQARKLTTEFIDAIPLTRERLAADVQAAMDGDPAAINTDEIILSYPGILAISVHRVAHTLYQLAVPLMPRVMSEWAHLQTGIDLHPGARVGRSFFIDHGTGVVIGETSIIGDDVTLYHSVTLGGTSPSVDSHNQIGQKRHPTILDRAIIGSGAAVLGPITIGEGAQVGANSVVTKDIPASVTAVGIPAKVIMPRDKAKAREFQPYGTPTDAGPDPVLQTIESLRGQVSALMKRVEELEAPLDSGEQPTPRKQGGQSG